MSNHTQTVPTVFQFQSQEVRVIVRDGEPWFVAADVCSALKILNPSDAIKSLDEDERARLNLGQSEMTLDLTEGQKRGRGGAQSVNIINESGMYALTSSKLTPHQNLRYAEPAIAKKAVVGRGNPQYLGCKAAIRAVFVLVHVLSVMGRACGQLLLVAIRDCDFPPRAYLLTQCVETLAAGELNFSETNHD